MVGPLVKLQLGWTSTKSDSYDRDRKGERGSKGDSRSVKPDHCFVTITNIERISFQNLSMYQ